MSLIETKALSVGWGPDQAVLRDVTLSLGRGVHCVVGPNGSGKTTLMRTLAGVLAPVSGQFSVNGLIGYLSHLPGIYSQLSVAGNLQTWARFLDPEGVTPWDELLKRFDLSDIAGRQASQLSQGQRQRLGLARAFLGEPDVLFLDEPTVGMDPTMKEKVQGIIHGAGKSACVLVSSHDLLEVSNIASDVIHVSTSQGVSHEKSSAVASKGSRRVRLAVEGKHAEAAVEALGSERAEVESSGWIRVSVSPEFSIAMVISTLEEHGFGIAAVDDLEGLQGYFKE